MYSFLYSVIVFNWRFNDIYCKKQTIPQKCINWNKISTTILIWIPSCTASTMNYWTQIIWRRKTYRSYWEWRFINKLWKLAEHISEWRKCRDKEMRDDWQLRKFQLQVQASASRIIISINKGNFPIKNLVFDVC